MPTFHRAALAVALCLGACGGAPRDAPEAQPAERHVAPTPIEAWLAAGRLVVERPTHFTEPTGSRERAGSPVSTWTSPEGLTVVERYAHGVVVSAHLEAPPTPAGVRVRLVPVLHPGFWPHHALLVEGEDEAIPYLDGRASELRIALAPSTLELSDHAAAREVTVRLRHSHHCPGRDGDCLRFGPEAELVEHVDPSVRPGGWWLETLPAAPHGTEWDPPIPQRDVPEVQLRAEYWDEAHPDRMPLATRVELVVYRRARIAFTVKLDYPLEDVPFVLRVTMVPEGRLLTVHLPDNGILLASLHHRQTGRRIGEPLRVALATDGNAHNLQGLALKPVLTGDGGLAAAIVFEDDALLFEPTEARGRWVPIELGGEQSAEDLRVARCGEVPCLRPAATPEPGGDRSR